MKSLQLIWEELAAQGHETDKLSVHSYGEVYEEILAPYRHTAERVLEIGIFKGDSMRMWEAYFTNAEVHGIDCSETPIDGMADLRPMINSGLHHIHIGDATDPDWVNKEFGDAKFQIVIDDSNHVLTSQIEAIEIFKDRITPGGIMIVEDLQCADMDIINLKMVCDEHGFRSEFIDLRSVKNRYDDCLYVIYF